MSALPPSPLLVFGNIRLVVPGEVIPVGRLRVLAAENCGGACARISYRSPKGMRVILAILVVASTVFFHEDDIQNALVNPPVGLFRLDSSIQAPLLFPTPSASSVTFNRCARAGNGGLL